MSVNPMDKILNSAIQNTISKHRSNNICILNESNINRIHRSDLSYIITVSKDENLGVTLGIKLYNDEYILYNTMTTKRQKLQLCVSLRYDGVSNNQTTLLKVSQSLKDILIAETNQSLGNNTQLYRIQAHFISDFDDAFIQQLKQFTLGMLKVEKPFNSIFSNPLDLLFDDDVIFYSNFNETDIATDNLIHQIDKIQH